MAGERKTWILTGSLDNVRVNVERGFDLIGFKERRRNQAEMFKPGDEVIFYVTGIQAFAAVARVTSEMFEDRTPVWPGTKDGKAPQGGPDAYPWRVEAEPVLVLPEEEFVPAVELVGDMEHASKWPAEHWHLAFQGQLRTIGEADRALLLDRIGAAAPSKP